MKKLLPLLSLLIIISCSKEIYIEEVVERGGLIYEVNSDEPFTGSVVDYWDNNQLESRREYKNGIPNGLTEEYYKNGQVEYKRTFKDGLPIDGYYEEYHYNGNLKSKFNVKDGEVFGLRENFYSDGKLESKLNFNTNSVISESFYKDGTLRERSNSKKGIMDGLFEEFYENGNLKSRVNYKNGRFGGLWEKFYENGNLKQRENWKDGKVIGLQELFYENGNLFTRTNYNKNGEEDGVEEYHYVNRDYSVTIWKDGKKEGTSTYYEYDGSSWEITGEKCYRNDEIILFSKCED